MAALNESTLTSLGTFGGGGLVVLTVAPSVAALTGLYIDGRASAEAPWVPICNAPSDYKSLVGLVSCSTSDGKGDVSNLAAGSTATLSLNAGQYSDIRVQATGLSGSTAVCTAVVPASIATDASGSTALVGADGVGVRFSPVSIRPALTNIIGMKPSGLSVTSGSASGRTWSTKMAAPGDFDAVRLVIYHHDVSATTSYQAIAAATEEERFDTDVNRYRPLVGGTEYSTLDTASESYGWRTLKFAGANAVVAAAGSATAPTVVVSDWLSLASVPRRDGAAFPLALIRVSAIGGTSSFSNGTANMATPSDANGGLIVQGSYIGDATGAMVTNPAVSNLIGNPNGNLMTVGIQFRCRKRGITLLGIGDSITQNAAVVADVYSSVGWRAAAAISALGIPCGYVNHGQASQPIQTYQLNGLAAIDNWKPNAAFMAAFSPNNGPYTSAGVMRYETQRAGGLVQEFISKAAQNNVIPMIATGVPCSSATIPDAARDSLRIAHNTTVRGFADGTYVLDWDALVTDQASPARIQTALQYDATHPNEAAVILQAAQLVRALRIAFAI